jgi:hypothetical protein
LDPPADAGCFDPPDPPEPPEPPDPDEELEDELASEDDFDFPDPSPEAAPTFFRLSVL